MASKADPLSSWRFSVSSEPQEYPTYPRPVWLAPAIPRNSLHWQALAGGLKRHSASGTQTQCMLGCTSGTFLQTLLEFVVAMDLGPIMGTGVGTGASSVGAV